MSDLNEAFAKWRAAHQEYLAAERKLADDQTKHAFGQEPVPLAFIEEVRRKRLRADDLLQQAVRLLEATRKGGAW